MTEMFDKSKTSTLSVCVCARGLYGL